MDLDFILTTIVYLVVIIYIHYMLKDNEINIDTLKKTHNEDDDILDVNENDSKDDINENIDRTEPELTNSNLIIDENEINDINNTAKDDFIKYLNIEEYDKGSNYQQLTAPLQENTLEVEESCNESNLDKFFTNIKDDQYNFNPVPTESRNSDDLMADKVLLNSEKTEVFAFDDFDQAFSSV